MAISYFGNSWVSWCVALVTMGFLLGSLGFLRRILLKRLKSLSDITETLIDDFFFEVLGGTKTYFLAAFSLHAASYLLVLPPEVRLAIYRVCVLVYLLQTSIWGSRAIAFWIERILKKRALSNSETATSIGLISFLVKFALFSLLALLGLHNFGFNITTLLAGFGVSGIAVALAVQKILGDLLASLSIVLDKPFVVGDTINVGEFTGAIEHIGLKTTRIRSLSGEQLIFSNGDLLQSRVRNFKRMAERRILFTLNLVYQTDVEKLARVPILIEQIISTEPQLRFERCHFLKFGEASLDIEVVYWVKSPEFRVYADAAQRMNLEILRRFAAEKIEFAYPTQTLILQRSRPVSDYAGPFLPSHHREPRSLPLSESN